MTHVREVAIVASAELAWRALRHACALLLPSAERPSESVASHLIRLSCVRETRPEARELSAKKESLLLRIYRVSACIEFYYYFI